MKIGSQNFFLQKLENLRKFIISTIYVQAKSTGFGWITVLEGVIVGHVI